MKKYTKFLLAALAGVAVVLLGRRFLHAPPHVVTNDDDDLRFDSDFIPGSRKLNLDLPDHVHHSWFKAPARVAEDQDEMFI